MEASMTIDHNDVWDNGWADYVNVITGTDDISADPLFVNAAVGDFHLRSDSPCIDAGTNVGAPDHDFEGDPRPDGCFVDIGADEYRGRTCHRIYLPLMLKNFTPPVTVVWLVRTNSVENAWEQDVVIPAFEAQHPGIKISLLIIVQPDIGPIREEMIRKGQPLHVWSPNWGGDGFASDRHRGWLTDLTPLIERDHFDLSDFVPRTVEMYNIGGHQYGLPMLSVGSYVYYNADLFDAAGVPYPPTDWDDTSWTWDAMVTKAISLTHDYGDRDTGQYGAMTGDAMEGPGLIFGQHIFPEGAYDTGLAKESYFDDPKVIQGFQARHDLMYADRVMPDAGIMDALSQLGGAFQSGRLAINQTGGWGYWNYKGLEGDFCWRVAPVPYGDPAYTGPRAIVYTDPWVITNGTDHLDEAWEFVKYLVGPEASRAYMQATNVPPLRQSLLDEWAEQFACMTPAEVRECYLGAFDYGIESSNHLMIRWSELDGVYQRWMDIFWNSPTTTASDLLPSLDADFEAILQKIKQEEE